MLIYQLVVFYVLTYVFVLLRCPWPNCSCEAGSGCQGKFVVDVTSWLVSCFKVNFFFFLGCHLMHVLCLPQSQSLQESLCLEQSISKGYAYVEFQNDTDARIAKLWMNRVGFSTMLV